MTINPDIEVLYCRKQWKQNALAWWLLLTILTVTASCKKEGSTPEPGPEPVDTTAATGIFYKLTRVENFKGDTTDNDPTAPKSNLYYSLETKASIVADYQKTTRWDISFGGLYQSFLSANNGADPANRGAGTSAIGGILILKQKFEDVVDIPADDQFKTKADLIGTDDSGAFGQGTGWYCYDFDGTLFGDGSYDKQHIAYTLQDTRTILLRTAKGNYAKIRMVSCYKDAFTPDKWFRNAPHMYFTFEYILVPKGSTRFEIK